MTEVFREMYGALENLRATLQNVEISPKIKEKVEELLTPLFANESNCQRITDIINEVGDFTENILVPLLEQYISANVAIRVKFLVEDLLVSIETYRDNILKKLATSQTAQTMVTRQDKVVDGSTMMRRLAHNSVTNHYREELYGSGKNERGKMQLKSLRSVAPNAILNKPSTGLNMSTRVNDIVNQQSIYGVSGLKKESRRQRTMAAIVANKQGNGLKEIPDLPTPQMEKSGQVLVKILAVGLNHSDYSNASAAATSRLSSFTAFNAEDVPHIAQIRNLRNSFLSFSQSVIPQEKAEKEKEETTEETKPVSKKLSDSVIGVEFCGIVKDIAWQKGDFLHKLHVSRDDIVFGILKGDDGLSKGALAELVVCDANDIVRVPRRIASDPAKAASLALDGALVCRSLASTDITNPRRAEILILGGATNLGSILFELLTGDMKIRMSPNNIRVVVTQDQVEYVTKLGVPQANVVVFEETGAWANGLNDGFFDVIFDCLSETKLTKNNFVKLVEKKLKQTGQITSMDSVRLLAEKKGRNEDFQKELQLISRLIEERRIKLPMFSESANVLDFKAGDVVNALDALKRGKNQGKSVVTVTEEGVEALKTRVETRVENTL